MLLLPSWRDQAPRTLSWTLENTENDSHFLFPLWHLIRDALLPYFCSFHGNWNLRWQRTPPKPQSLFDVRERQCPMLWWEDPGLSRPPGVAGGALAWFQGGGFCPKSPSLGKSLTASNHRFLFSATSRRQPTRGCDGGDMRRWRGDGGSADGSHCRRGHPSSPVYHPTPAAAKAEQLMDAALRPFSPSTKRALPSDAPRGHRGVTVRMTLSDIFMGVYDHIAANH